jgi:metal-responsive CopG/Arc/MetJ family transcriptional regulator
MADLVRLGISINSDLIAKFHKIIEERRYVNPLSVCHVVTKWLI